MAAESTSYTDRFAEYYRRMEFPCRIAENILWLQENRMISPLGPACRSYVVPPSATRALLASFRGAILVKYTDGFHADLTSSPWYCVVCRAFVDLDEYNAKKRSQIRKGLRECVVERVDARYIAKYGYDVYRSAVARYANGRSPAGQEKFRRRLLVAADFNDVIDYWAVRHGNTLVGYAQVHLFDNIEAGYSSMTFDPAGFQFYSSYALIYRMNEYYLREKCMEYVNDGFRTLLHPSELQQLLIRKFGFERAYTNLHVRYRPAAALMMSLPGPAKRVLSRFSARLSALCNLHEARTRGVE